MSFKNRRRYRGIRRYCKFAVDWRFLRSILVLKDYAGGLAIQKGVPILLLPLFVLYFGKENVAVYGLFYSTALLIAVISGVGIPLAIVPLWHSFKEPDVFIRTATQTTLLGSLLIAILLLVSVFFGLSEFTFGGLSGYTMAALLSLFSLMYNFSQIASAVCRIDNRHGVFLAASALGAMTLAVGACSPALVGSANLQSLIIIQGVALFLPSLLMIGRRLRWIFSRFDFDATVAKLLARAAIPLAANSALVLLSMSIDRWVARIFFPLNEFANYIIDFQSAMAVLLVPSAIALYIGPKMAEAFARDEIRTLQREVILARWLTGIGSIASGAGVYIYGFFTGLGLTYYFWILVIKFSLEGQYLISSNEHMIRGNFWFLVKALIVSNVILALILSLSSVLESILLLYVSSLIYEISLFVMVTSRRSVRVQGAA